MFGPVNPYGQGFGGFQVGWGGLAAPVADMSAQIYGGSGGGCVSFGFGSAYGGMGTYYGFGCGYGGGPGFQRQPGPWGQWGWGRSAYGGNPIARDMAGVAGLADSVFGTTPWGIDQIFNQREQAYNDYMAAQQAKRQAGQNAQGEGKAAPQNLADRANDYFDGIVGGHKKSDKVYTSEGNKQIREWEKSEGESNPSVKGREQNLIDLAKRIDSWMNGDNSDAKRGEFLAQIDAWVKDGKGIDSKRKLLALVAPGAEEPKDIPQGVAQKLMQQLGDNRTPEDATAESVFEAYEQMLKERFGPDYDAIIDDYYNKARAMAKEKGGTAVQEVTTADIIAKGFKEDEARKIYEKAFKGKPAITQRRLLKKSFPDVTGKDDKERVQLLGSWYLQAVKDKSEKEEINDLLNQALVTKETKTVAMVGKTLTDQEKTNAGITGEGDWVLAAGAKKWKKRDTFQSEDTQRIEISADGKITRMYKPNKNKDGWELQTQKTTKQKANYNIGRMLDKLDELTSKSAK